MSPWSNWTTRDELFGLAFFCGFDHDRHPEPRIPESTGRDWTLVAAPPNNESFRFVLCPSPEPESNWLRATTVNRTVRGYELVSSAASLKIRLATCAGFGLAPVEPQYVFGADTSATPEGKPKAGTRYRWRCFLFAGRSGVRFFSAEENFVS